MSRVSGHKYVSATKCVRHWGSSTETQFTILLENGSMDVRRVIKVTTHGNDASPDPPPLFFFFMRGYGTNADHEAPLTLTITSISSRSVMPLNLFQGSERP